jgi:hypothetical protein
MNILTLSTYPVETPRHGGQIRLSNIVAAYRAAGHTVNVTGVMGGSFYTADPAFETYPEFEALASQIENPFLMEDWVIGRLYERDNVYFGRLSCRIEQAPDVIHVEQPWLSAFAKRFVEEVYPNDCKIIYGSANIEHMLKKTILKQYIGQFKAEAYGELVLATEIEAIRSADGIACVSDNDLSWTRQSAKAPSVLAPNGVGAWSSTRRGRALANEVTRGRKFALYCASAHPPNITGFTHMFSGGAGCIAPDELIVAAGSVGEHLVSSPQLCASAGLPQKLISAGVVDEECLHGLLDLAHCIILPLTQGGGTNLKTAEALWSGKHVVSTTIGMRGFESFLDAPGVRIADTPAAFKQSVRDALASPANELSKEERDRRRPMLWENSLRSLVELAESLVE